MSDLCCRCGELPVDCDCIHCEDHGWFRARGVGWRRTHRCPVCDEEGAADYLYDQRKDDRLDEA